MSITKQSSAGKDAFLDEAARPEKGSLIPYRLTDPPEELWNVWNPCAAGYVLRGEDLVRISR